jgi:hypothetical protein
LQNRDKLNIKKFRKKGRCNFFTIAKKGKKKLDACASRPRSKQLKKAITFQEKKLHPVDTFSGPIHVAERLVFFKQ